MDNEKLKKQVLDKISQADNHQKSTIEPAAQERLNRLRADKDFYREMYPNLPYNTVDTSVMSAVERITAALVKIVFGNDDVGTVKGRTAGDDDSADNMQELCNWQIEYKNKGYQKFYWWLKEAVYQLYSAVKVTQRREFKEVEEQQQSMPYSYLDAFIAQCEQNKVEITDVQEDLAQQGNIIPTVKYTKLVENYPEIVNVPADELIWTPDGTTLKECSLVAHVKAVTVDHLRRNIKKKQADGSYTGMYDKAAVEEVAAGGSNVTQTRLNITRNKGATEVTYDKDDANRKVNIAECYLKYDMNGDDLLEDAIVTLCLDTSTVLRQEENEDGFPFCIASPLFDPHKVVPEKGAIDNLGQWQDLLTAIIRLSVQNLAINNNPQQVVNPSMFTDFNQVLDGDNYLEVNGPLEDAIRPVAQIPLAPQTLNFIEMVKGWGEEASSVNRYNQGIDANSLNKTATGMQLLVNQGSQALELMMRNIAETGMKDLFMRFIFLNQKYIDQEQVIRLTDRDLKVNKDNLAGDFDYIVNSGMGSGAKETDIQNMTTMVDRMPTLIQGGIATSENAFNAVKKLFNLMGIRNTDEYLTDPAKMPQKPPPAPDASETISVKFEDLPISCKVQMLQRLGLQVTPQDFIQEMQLQAQQEAMTAQVKAQADIAKVNAQEQAKTNQVALQHQHQLKAAEVQHQGKLREAIVNGQIRATTVNRNGGGGQSRQPLPGGDIQADQGQYPGEGSQIPGISSGMLPSP